MVLLLRLHAYSKTELITLISGPLTVLENAVKIIFMILCFHIIHSLFIYFIIEYVKNFMKKIW